MRANFYPLQYTSLTATVVQTHNSSAGGVTCRKNFHKSPRCRCVCHLHTTTLYILWVHFLSVHHTNIYFTTNNHHNSHLTCTTQCSLLLLFFVSSLVKADSFHKLTWLNTTLNTHTHTLSPSLFILALSINWNQYYHYGIIHHTNTHTHTHSQLGQLTYSSWLVSSYYALLFLNTYPRYDWKLILPL